MSKVYPDLILKKYGVSWDIESLKDGLMEMEEKCFPESIQGDWSEIRGLIESSVSCYFFIDLESVEIIASAYAISMEKEEDIDKSDPHYAYWLETIKKYEGQKVAYLYSISVLPSHSGKDLAKRLMIELLADCKAKGYDVLLSHAKEGASLHLHDFFGGIHINSVENWYDTGATHTLCSINLHNTVMIPLREPIGQSLGWDCGIASLENLLHHKGIQYNRESLIKQSGVNNQGTTHDGMSYALGVSSLEPVLFMDDGEPDIQKLHTLLSMGHPVIIHVLSPGTYEGHYLVLMGENEESFYVFEVYDALFGRMSKQELKRVWWNNTTKTSWGIALSYQLKDGIWQNSLT